MSDQENTVEPVTVHHGDCLEVMRSLPDASVDAIVTDPPYELAFMGRSWDASGIAYNSAVWAECLRVAKPGAHLLAFGGTRTYHRLTCAIEDTGFEIRDSLHWIYGSGFPKSLDVSKAIDKAAGAEREVVGQRGDGSAGSAGGILNMNGRDVDNGSARDGRVVDITAPATDDAAHWQGWGTALKPAHEPIVVARKPIAGTVAANVLEHGTGALNIDGCRVATTDSLNGGAYAQHGSERHDGTENWRYKRLDGAGEYHQPAGRWPPNILLTHSADCGGEWCAPDCPVAELDRQSGVSKSTGGDGRGYGPGRKRIYGDFGNQPGLQANAGGLGDVGGASRFFPCFRYQAKAPSGERPRLPDGTVWPTVKPLALMRWLVRLVTPPDGLVLDPFAGTGTTAQACLAEGFQCVLIERDPAAMALIGERLRRPVQPELW